MIKVAALAKSYGNRPILSDVRAEFSSGHLTSLIGPNGAGKSTLLMLIARLLAPTSGIITIDGTDIASLAVGDYARRVATLRQRPDCNMRLSVEELVTFGRFPHSRGRLTAEDRRAVNEAIAFLSLEPLRNALIDEISGGQRQMAFLAMTIAQETQCLLLDEPLNNLDMKHAVQIMQALRTLCDDLGRTVIAVIHDINFAANYSDHIVAMKDGAVHAAGSVSEVVTESGLGELYGLDLEIVERQQGCLCNYFTQKGKTR